MTQRRRFTVSAPDWGHAHLSSDAVVAFVDDELAHGPHARAVAHISACPDCAAEVVSQRQARTALRGASGPSLPTSLLSSLRSIPQDTELPAPPAGLAVTAEGQLVSVLRPEPCGPGPEQGGSAKPTHSRRLPGSRRLRIGAGAAMSGLALGALALGSAALPGEQAPTPPADRGLFGGSVVGPASVAPARLGIGAGKADAGKADAGKIDTGKIETGTTDAGGRQPADDPARRLVDRAGSTPRTFLRHDPH